ncbi:MAG: hydrolase, partial [Bacteroidota bacterium]
RRKIFYTNYRINAGQYFNGQRFGIRGDLTFRMQPFGFLSANVAYNRITLPATATQPDTTVNLLLIGPRLDVTFTRKLFFTLFTQYNSQLDNLNFNARLQWRYKPVSDLFLVYIDNYQFSDAQWQPYNRALILKLTYWLNV